MNYPPIQVAIPGSIQFTKEGEVTITGWVFDLMGRPGEFEDHKTGMIRAAFQYAGGTINDCLDRIGPPHMPGSAAVRDDLKAHAEMQKLLNSLSKEE